MSSNEQEQMADSNDSDNDFNEEIPEDVKKAMAMKTVAKKTVAKKTAGDHSLLP